MSVAAAAAAAKKPVIPANQVLPTMEDNKVKQIMRLIDEHQPTRALKLVDSILEGFPQNAQALSLKALCFHSIAQEKKDTAAATPKVAAGTVAVAPAAPAVIPAAGPNDAMIGVPPSFDGAYTLAKKAIMAYPASSQPWHTLGILYKRDKKFEDALKAWKRALQLDINMYQGDNVEHANQNLFRDITTMCIHCRDWDTMVQVRERANLVKSNVRFNWITLAVAKYQNHQFPAASAIMDVMNMILDAPDDHVEAMECLLFRVELAIACKEYTKASKILHEEILQAAAVRSGLTGPTAVALKDILTVFLDSVQAIPPPTQHVEIPATKKAFQGIDSYTVLALLAKTYELQAQEVLSAPKPSKGATTQAHKLKEDAEKCLMKLIHCKISERDNICHIGRLRGFLSTYPLQTASTTLLQGGAMNAESVVEGGGAIPPRTGLLSNFYEHINDAAGFLNLLDEISTKEPKCDASKRLALDVTTDIADFERRFQAYAKPFVVKMIPSIVSVFDSLYGEEHMLYQQRAWFKKFGVTTSTSTAVAPIAPEVFFPQKRLAMEKIVQHWRSLVQTPGASLEELYGPAGTKGSGIPSPGMVNPQLLVWIDVFLCALYRAWGNLEKSLELINEAITHTPTIEVLYLHKAETLALMADKQDASAAADAKKNYRQEAAECADLGRRLDLQDKYMTSEAARFWLMAGELTKADRALSTFHAISTYNDTYLTMYDTQTHWYEVAAGDACLYNYKYRTAPASETPKTMLSTTGGATPSLPPATQDVVSALQHYLLIEEHFKDNHEDMIDFHQYTLRRCMIRNWLDAIEMEDHFGSTKFYLAVAAKIVECYLLVDSQGKDAVKAKHFPRHSVRPWWAPKPAAGSTPVNDKLDTEVVATENGVEFVEMLDFPIDDRQSLEKKERRFVLDVDLEQPLVKCSSYLKNLQRYAAHVPKTWELSFEVDLRSQRWVLCAKSLRALVPLWRISAASGTTLQKYVAEGDQKLQSMKSTLLTKMGASTVDARVKAVVTKILAEAALA